MGSSCSICGTPLFVLVPGETTCQRCRLCKSCSAEFSEERALHGEKLCERCAQAEQERFTRAAAIPADELPAALEADAPQPVPLALPLLDRYPKYRAWIEREEARVVREPIPIMTDFVIAVGHGAITANDARAQIDLQRVAAWFKDFLNSSPPEGASMDKVMGLRGVGKTPAMQAAWEKRLDRMLFNDMILFQSLDPITPEKAAEIVCSWYENADPVLWNELSITRPSKVGRLEPGALAQRFRKAGLNHPDFVAFMRREIGPFRDEDVGHFLEQFRDEVLTENLKDRKRNFQRDRRAS